MTTIFSPYRIELLLHFHCTPEPWPNPEAPIYQGEVDSLVSGGAIFQAHRLDGVPQYRTTPLGDAWVKALCNVPAPEERTVFVDQLGNILE